MTSLFIVTGGFVWGLIAIAALYLLGEVVWACACNISYHRWVYRKAKFKGNKLAWSRLPISFLAHWWWMLGHRNGASTWSDDTGGTWKGIGNWTLGWKEQQK